MHNFFIDSHKTGFNYETCHSQLDKNWQFQQNKRANRWETMKIDAGVCLRLCAYVTEAAAWIRSVQKMGRSDAGTRGYNERSALLLRRGALSEETEDLVWWTGA